MTQKTLRVLLLEDDPADAALVERELDKDPETRFEITHVTDETGFRAVLGRGWDAILADHRLPGFDARAALRLVTGAALDTPFIVVSGTIGDEATTEVMREGAADFVGKDRLARLALTINRRVAEVHERRRLQESTARLRQSLTKNELLDLHLRELELSRIRAFQLHDGALQQLVVAQAALESQDLDRATRAVRSAFEGVQRVLAQLIPEDLAPGALQQDASQRGDSSR